MNISHSISCLQASFIVLMSSALITPAHAFDLFDAWQAALNYSADYAAAQHGRDAEREQKYQARAALLPQISANSSIQKQPQALSTTTQSHGWNVQASQSLFDKSRWAKYQQGKLAARMADEKLSNAEEELLIKVAQAYFQVLLAQDKLVSIAQEKKAYQLQIKQTIAMFEKGAATILDTNEAQAGFEAARAKETSTLTDLLLAENTLANLTNLNPKNIKPIHKSKLENLLGKTSQSDWLNLAQARNPEWKLQKLALENAKQGLIAAKSAHWPTLSLNGGYQDNHNTQEYHHIEQQYRSKGGTISLQMSIPLFSGGQIRSQVREAAAREQQNQALLLATERKIKLSVDQAYQTTLGGQYQIQAQQQLLKASQVKLNATQLGRKVGVRSNLDELQAEQAKAEAEQKLAEAQYNYITSYLQLLQNAGILTDKEQQRKIRQWLH